MSDIIKSFQAHIPSFLFGTLILTIGWWLSGKLTRLIKAAMVRANICASIATFTCSLSNTVLKIIVLLMALPSIGINVSALAAALGASAVAVGLAMKDSIANFSSGLFIITSKQFKIGDYLKIDSIEGTVTKVEIFFTSLLTASNTKITIPNSTIASKHITTYNTEQDRRLILFYPISYSTDFLLAKEALTELIESQKLAFKTPVPLIIIDEYHKTHIQLALHLWCAPADYQNLRNEIQESIKTLFTKNILKQVILYEGGKNAI